MRLRDPAEGPGRRGNSLGHRWEPLDSSWAGGSFEFSLVAILFSPCRSGRIPAFFMYLGMGTIGNVMFFLFLGCVKSHFARQV